MAEKDLSVLLATVSAKLHDGVYCFATLAPENVPSAISFRMRFEEDEGTTLILTEDQAKAHGIAYEFPCRMITLNVHSALEAVGFIAHISTKLADAGMGVNPVAGFFHDHLFIPLGREQDAMDIIAKVAKDNAQS